MARRRLRQRLPFFSALAALVLAVLGYVVGLAWLQARYYPLFEAADLYVPRSIDALIVLWCIWVGSSIGSFLNVVAWRMPRGESINGRSRCPRCHVQLRARDNFPVLGWLALGGRCRTCRLPISARYPIVEAAVGLTLTSVALAELYRLNLPHQQTVWRGGPLWSPIITTTVLVTLLYHTIGIAISWAFGLIRMDGNRLPARLVGFAALVMLIPMLVYPTLMVVPWQMEVGSDWRPDGLFVDALVRILTALAAATVLARYLAKGLCPSADPKLDPLGKSTARLLDLVAILAVPIVIVGWQAAPALAVLASLIAFMSRRFLPPRCDAMGRFAIAMPLALTFQLVLWRRLHANASGLEEGRSIWPSDNGSPWVVLFWSAIVLMVPLWLNDLDRRESEPPG